MREDEGELELVVAALTRGCLFGVGPHRKPGDDHRLPLRCRQSWCSPEQRAPHHHRHCPYLRNNPAEPAAVGQLCPRSPGEGNLTPITFFKNGARVLTLAATRSGSSFPQGINTDPFLSPTSPSPSLLPGDWSRGPATP